MNYKNSNIYGKELIIDLHKCKIKFTRENIYHFMVELCELIEMERADLHFWDYDSEEEKMLEEDHLAGTSAVQFITTSNITIHTLDKLGNVYLNIFSCKDFDEVKALQFCEKFWNGIMVSYHTIERK